MASHDINLVSQMCDHVLLLMGDGSYLPDACPKFFRKNIYRKLLGAESGALKVVKRLSFSPQPDAMAVLKERVCEYHREA